MRKHPLLQLQRSVRNGWRRASTPMALPTIQTLCPPGDYTRAQIDRALLMARALNRGLLVLCEPPKGKAPS